MAKLQAVRTFLKLLPSESAPIVRCGTALLKKNAVRIPLPRFFRIKRNAGHGSAIGLLGQWMHEQGEAGQGLGEGAARGCLRSTRANCASAGNSHGPCLLFITRVGIS